MTKQAQVMVVAPHPDDAEFGVAGSVAKWVKEGKEVVYVLATNGDKGTSDINMPPEKLVRIREKEQMTAAKMVGVNDVVFLGHPDQSLEDTDEFRKEIVRLIRMYRPETVVTSDPYRRYVWHRDHRITGRVVLDAVFPYARDHLSYPDLLKEGLKPHKVKEILFWGAEEQNCHLDITDTFNVKIAALSCHRSQIKDHNSSDLTERMRKHYQVLAKGENYELAEAFHRVELRR
ncbi:PIG-L deacetylase family protein [Chloroflexota bacterium]